MNIIKNIKNYCGAAIILVAGTTVTLNSCTENIDDSDLYTFTGEMMIDYLENRPETFSNYVELLGKVHPSKRSASTMKDLLSARGHYTSFAPTNEAIQMYLDSLANIGQLKSNKLSEITDSVAEAIVFNSIIQNGDNEAYAKTDFEEGALGTTNMNDRFVSISYSNDSLGNTLVYVNVNSLVINSTEEKEVENGHVHTIDKVLSPSNASVADLLMTAENTRIFGGLLEATGWDKKLQNYKDQEWEDYWTDYDDIPGKNIKPVNNSDWNPYYPEHRYIGYTVFAETDSVFHANGITDIPTLREWVKEHANYDDDTNQGHATSWGDDFHSDYNWLNQFVAYHLLPERITYNHLVSFSNEYGCESSAVKSRTAAAFYVNVWEYWETMGIQRRLLKVTGIRGAKMINRVSVYNKNTYKERLAEMTDFGITISATNGQIDNAALNGYYYPIDNILIWDAHVPNKVLNERMRYDVSAMIPELLTNNIRQYGHEDRSKNYILTPDYSDNIYNMTQNTQFIYLVNTNYSGSSGSWMNYKIDEFNIIGNVDFTMKLPPVPYTGTYEIRYGINANNNRGMAQVYIGTNKDNLPAIGIPLDLRSSSGTNESATGWIDDANLADEEAINENDKAMRNLGFMKGPKYMQFASGKTGRDVSSQCIRKIIYNGQLEAGKTYWIRFKSVLQGTSSEFFYDYLEIVPKSIYAGEEAEDKW